LCAITDSVLSCLVTESNVSSVEEDDDPIDYNNLSDELHTWEGPETSECNSTDLGEIKPDLHPTEI